MSPGGQRRGSPDVRAGQTFKEPSMILGRDYGKRYIRGHRVHHGLIGLAFIATGVVLCADDWIDRRVWIADFRLKLP